MGAIILQAHFDGEYIQLDEPYTLEPNTKILVTVFPKRQNDDECDKEREDWLRLSAINFERAFGDDEPEYTLDMIKEVNPNYEGK